MLLTGAITAEVAAPPVIEIVCPVLRQMVQHQEDNISTYETQFPGSAGAIKARDQWEPKKTITLAKIKALEELAQQANLFSHPNETVPPGDYLTN